MKLIEALKLKKHGAIRKWQHYFSIYDSYFEKIQNEPIKLLEIGVGWGGSVFAWREYFPNARIVGIDINSRCKKYQDDKVTIYIGDQANPTFLESVNSKEGPFDIIIDDGGHMMREQTTSLRNLFPRLKNGGYYVIEDWHTSYVRKYQDGTEKTVDFLERLVEGLNYWAIAGRKPGYFSLNVASVHFHNGIVFIKKGKNRKGLMFYQ